MDEPGNRMDEPGDRMDEPADRMDEPADRMDEPGEGPYAEPDPFDRLGAIVGPRLDELRALVDDLQSRWRGDAVRLGEETRHRLRGIQHELGLVTRDDWDELDLRVAQLEHRLRLLEEKTGE
jgi:hypothetical protein